MADNNVVKGTMDGMMENLKGMVDSNSVIGDPITTPDGTTIIPVSKISYGFGTGGGNAGMSAKSNLTGFGAGGGGGITVTPVAFLSIKDGVVKMIQVEPFISSVDRVIEKMPDMMDKVGDFLDDKKEERAAKKAEKKAEKEAAKELKKLTKDEK
ncbi:MAG: spore germination protein GerW family protein [Oscillospiraceae bacterium]|nr:spore germination protein GerW family protein [Oscillospiraceae bacterium]